MSVIWQQHGLKQKSYPQPDGILLRRLFLWGVFLLVAVWWLWPNR